MAFNSERTGPPKPGLRVENQQTGGEELLSPQERVALDEAGTGNEPSNGQSVAEGWNDPVAEQFFAEGENLPAEKNISIEHKTETAQTTVERYVQKAWNYFKQYVDPPVEDPAAVRERERVREERRFLFSTVDKVFDKKTAAAAQEALLGHTVTVQGEMYRLDKWVGQGGFGVVYEATTPADKRVIVKLSHSFSRDLLSKPIPAGTNWETTHEAAQGRSAVVESASLKRLSEDPVASVYFPKFYGGQLAPNPDRKRGEPDRRIALQVMERIDGVDLGTMLNQEKNLTKYSEYTLQLAQQLTLAVQHMHRANVLHLDLKPGNMMIAEDGSPKIIDFGTGQLPDKQQMTKGGTVTEWAKLLVTQFSQGYVTKAEQPIASRARDTYALGRTIQNLLYGRFTNATRNDPAAFAAYRQPLYAALDVNLKSLSVLADRMTAEDPMKRITLAEAESILHGIVKPMSVEAQANDEDYVIVDEEEHNQLQNLG
ncbi:MAG: protein kinase [Candidatus Kerfeldbacteria bacterium]|nr:protein kinase [Candidatus Kerfeldbacteria bacterium]